MKLFRDENENVKSILNLYQTNPLDIFFTLARYKFASKLINPSDTVLDAGCGLGIGSVMISKFAKQVIGIDIDDNLIKSCMKTHKEISNIHFKVEDIKNPIFDKYDAIIFMDVIEHVNKLDGKIIINNLYNSLNESGILIVGTPNIESQKYASENRKNTHLYEYDYDNFKKLFSYNFKRTIIFSMTDEIVSTGFSSMAWYFIAVAIK